MKRVVLLGPNYPPETNAAAKRMGALAEFLVSRGWRVHVVTLLPHYPQNRIYDGFDLRTPQRSVEDGVHVERLRPWIVPRDNLSLRLLSETLFCMQTLSRIVMMRPDVVYASSPYMFLGPAGWLGARLRGAKFVWELRDLTWEYAKATGRRRYGLDVPLEMLMRQVARHADALITATEGQLPYFHERPPYALVVPNGLADEALERLAPHGEAKEPAPGGGTIMYAGLFGYPQALSTLIGAAGTLPSMCFVLVGDGPERALLEEEAAAAGAGNVRFEGYVPFDSLVERYRCADILVAHLRDSPAFRVAQPSKVWEYMATGKPVVYAGSGEAAQIIREHDIGVVVEPENPRALALALQGLAGDPARRRELGARGRAFVEDHRRRRTLLERVGTLLDALTG